MPATLLLADESATTQRVAELTLARNDVRVIGVGDGEEALREIEADPPDIVLADVGLPLIDGYAVASQVKSSPTLRHIPVLLLTGPFDPIDEAKARETGCDGVLVKPLDFEQLTRTVLDLLAGRRSPSLWSADLPRVEGQAEPVEAPKRPAHVEVPEPPVKIERIETAGQPVWQPARSAPPEEPTTTVFESALDQLDANFGAADLPIDLDEQTTSDFARDIDQGRGIDHGAVAAYRTEFGDWEVPVPQAPDESAALQHERVVRPEPADAAAFAQPRAPAIPEPRPVAPAPEMGQPLQPTVRERRQAKVRPEEPVPPIRQPVQVPSAAIAQRAPTPSPAATVAAPSGLPAPRAASKPVPGVAAILDSTEARRPIFAWQHRPFTVAKLRDVMGLDTRHFARLPRALTVLEAQLKNRAGVLPQGVRTKISKTLVGPLTECREVGFTSSAKCIGRIQAQLARPKCTVEEIAALFSDFERRLEDDAELCTALLIPASTAELYRNPQKGWRSILDRFPALTPEIEEANKCLAVGRYTATVFHLSRVMETGLAALGGALNLHRKHAPTWTAVLALIEKKVARQPRGKKGLPRSRQELKEERFLAKAADYLRNVQGAWRSDDMRELRHIYDAQTAAELLTSVQAFMRHLAVRFHE